MVDGFQGRLKGSQKGIKLNKAKKLYDIVKDQVDYRDSE